MLLSERFFSVYLLKLILYLSILLFIFLYLPSQTYPLSINIVIYLSLSTFSNLSFIYQYSYLSFLIYLHKLILYLSILLSINSTAIHQSILVYYLFIFMKDLSPEVVDQMLHYIYTGNTPNLAQVTLLTLARNAPNLA